MINYFAFLHIGLVIVFFLLQFIYQYSSNKTFNILLDNYDIVIDYSFMICCYVIALDFLNKNNLILGMFCLFWNSVVVSLRLRRSNVKA